MKESINFRGKDELNSFSTVQDLKELLKIRDLLEQRKNELETENQNYEGDDSYGIKHEYEITLRDFHNIEQEIKRRVDNN